MTIIKILVMIYLALSFIYFLLTGKENLIYSVKYSSTTWAKIYSVFWIIGFSAVMGGFLVLKKAYYVGKRASTIYKTYKAMKDLDKKLKNKLKNNDK